MKIGNVILRLSVLTVPNMNRISRFHEKKHGINNVLYDKNDIKHKKIDQ